MKFRTEIEPRPLTRKIDHSRRGLVVGSCFADRIAGLLQRAKFPVTGNPDGVLYNPFSIADALEAGIADADYIIITFGTAWVYEENGRVVANCGKRPAHLFTRRRLSVEEIVARFDALFEGTGKTGDTESPDDPHAPLAGKQVIFTLSPIRHLKDGFEENSLSKATLRVAIAEIVARHPEAEYFPAFEILCDDLRDYRFYDADLVHPSRQAVDYIWDKFSAAAFSADTLKLLPRIEEIVRAAEHRPFDPDSAEHKEFRRSMVKQAQELRRKFPLLDLSTEIEFFREY